MRHFLSAVHEALQIPVPARPPHRWRYLKLLERRAAVARLSISRLLADASSNDLDFISEADHIRQTIADMPSDTWWRRAR